MAGAFGRVVYSTSSLVYRFKDIDKEDEHIDESF